jgi:HD-like signal output (HDOD) protein
MDKISHIKSGTDILNELESIRELQTIPTTINKILQEISDPNANMDKIANLIMNDQVLTVGVMKLVNSSYFALSKKITSLRHGIVLLGLKKIRDIVLTTIMLDHFHIDSSILNRNHFWSHALGCAKGTSFLEPANNKISSDMFYVAGLIHDIGELILAQYFPDEFRLIYETAQHESVDLFQTEKEILGITHCDIGEKFAIRWNFPTPIINAIKYHHFPEQAGGDQLIAAVINLSDLFARLLGLNYGINESLLVSIAEQPGYKILKEYNDSLENEDWERFSLDLTEQYKQIIESVENYFKTNGS